MAFRMVERIDSQVDVERRPVQMVRVRAFDLSELPDGGVLEPGDRFEGDEHLSVVNEKPEPERRDVGDLNARTRILRIPPWQRAATLTSSPSR